MKKKLYGEEVTETKKGKKKSKMFEIICYALGVGYWVLFMYSL
jgi:hypothetical protein